MEERVLKKMASGFGAHCGKLVYRGFNHYTKEAAKTQEDILFALMNDNKDTEYGKKYNFADIHSIKDYQDKVPLSDYKTYEDYVSRMIKGEKNLITASKITRYVETSGSVGKPKIIPQVKKAMFLFQSMGFAAPVGCAAKYFEDRGGHLAPQRGLLALEATSHRLPNGELCSCLSSAPILYMKPISSLFTTSPKEVLFPKNAEEMDMQYLKFRFALPDKNVTYIGAMIVTVTQTLFSYLEDNWEMLTDDIEKGVINDSIRIPQDVRIKLEKKLKPEPERAAELRREFKKGFDTPIVPRIWPKVEWMYAMMSGNLSVYDKKLRRYTGNLPLHNMGYGSSEALMAIPLELNAPDCVMLPRSGFYEFLPVGAPEGTRPLTLTEVKEGEAYEIILTNLSGLYRYRMEDVVKVTGFYQQSPKIEFLYRANLIMNICAEKMTQPMLDYAVETAAEEHGVPATGYSVYADNESDPAAYAILIEPENTRLCAPAELAESIDRHLEECNLDYAKFRHSGAIGAPAVSFIEKGTYEAYRQILRERGVNLNQVKPVCVINNEEKKEFFTAHII